MYNIGFAMVLALTLSDVKWFIDRYVNLKIEER